MSTPAKQQFYILDDGSSSGYGPSVDGPFTEAERELLWKSRKERGTDDFDQIYLDVTFLPNGNLSFEAYRMCEDCFEAEEAPEDSTSLSASGRESATPATEEERDTSELAPEGAAHHYADRRLECAVLYE